jgi:hypothetical protein
VSADSYEFLSKILQRSAVECEVLTAPLRFAGDRDKCGAAHCSHLGNIVRN